MKQFAIIGLSKFGKWMIEEFLSLKAEILIVDKDREVIELYKDRVSAAYIADIMNEQVLRKIIPTTIDAAIIDVGDRIEASILATSHLHKMGIKNIIVKAENNEHGEILEIVGANQVIFPNREAAKRIAPILYSSEVFNYFPISSGLVIAEILLPERLKDKTLIEADFRKTSGLNVIAIREELEKEYVFVAPDYRLKSGDMLLLVGTADKIAEFSDTKIQTQAKDAKQKKRLFNFFKSPDANRLT